MLVRRYSALTSAAAVLLFSATVHAQSIPSGFVCGFAGPRTPFKRGADTVTFSQSVQCVAPVNTVDLSIELLVFPAGSTQELRVAAESIFEGPRVIRGEPYFSENALEVLHAPCFNGQYFARLSAVVTLGDGRTIGGNAITPVAVVGNCSGSPTAPPPDVPPLPPPDIPPMGPMFPDTPTTSPTQVIDMVRNKPLGEAVVILMDRGFRAGAVTERPDPNVPKGNVITGSLSVDTPNFIDLVVSSGSLVFSSELHLRCDTQKKTASFPLCFNLRNSPCRTQGETVVCRVPTDVELCDAEKRFNGEARPTGVKQLRCGL